MSTTIHKHSDVQSKNIGANTRIWQYCVILPEAKIGEDCNICSHCFIENKVKIGDRVTVKFSVHICDGITIGDDVFIGPQVSFTNDKHPRSKQYLNEFPETIVENNASIGSGAIILPSVTIGEGAMVGAGSVVTKSVPAGAIVVGNPARIVGYVNVTKAIVSPIETHASQIIESCVKGVSLKRLGKFSDMRGSLTVGELETHIPFQVSRYFSIFDVPTTEVRGAHAHKDCHQFLVCLKGSCKLMVDDGNNKEEYLLNSPDIGVHISPMVWAVQYQYSSDAILLVLASHKYDEADYIRDYNKFLELVI